MIRVAIATAILAAAGPALAQPGADIAAEAPPPRHAVSLHLLSLGTRGLALEGERQLRRRFSAVAGLALRSPARGDYESLSITGSGEARWWITGRAPWTGLAAGAMVGPYLGVRVDASRTATTEAATGRGIGSTLTLAESLTAGYRFAFWGRLEITPKASLGVRHEIDLGGRLAPWTRGALGFAMTAGVLF